jgi:2-oxoglutarate dehydrogenase E1 component
MLDADLENVAPAELELSHYGWTERDLDKVFNLGPGILPHFAKDGRAQMTLREIVETCRSIYCTHSLSQCHQHLLHLLPNSCL